MKKLKFLIFTMIIFCGHLIHAQDHQWPLTADVNDVVGGLNGTNNGITFQNDAERGDVAIFDGAAAYADMPSFMKDKSAMTISVWFKPDYENQ